MWCFTPLNLHRGAAGKKIKKINKNTGLLPQQREKGKQKPSCAADIGLTGSLKDLLISVWGENAAGDFDKVSVFTDNWALSTDIGRRLLKREVERGEAEGHRLFTVTQPCVCRWRGGLTKGEASSVLNATNFPSWQSLSQNSSQCEESLLHHVDDDKPAELWPQQLCSHSLWCQHGAPPPVSPPTNKKKWTEACYIWLSVGW